MPKTVVHFFRDGHGDVPVLDWLKELRRTDTQAYANCVAVIQRLSDDGHTLRRPTADYLRDKIYELRAKHGRVSYRILYFFHGQNVAILAHALTKEDVVPRGDIERAIARRRQYEEDPKTHTHSEPTE